MNLRKRGLASVLLVAAGLAATAASAQLPRPAMPSPEVIAKADSFDPPMLDGLGAKLQQQPDMTGTWMQVQPAEAGGGPVFDPVNAHFSKQALTGESTFGPIPGTYLTNIPYTPEYKKLYEQRIQEIEQGKDRDTFAACVPYGVPRMLGGSPVGFDIVQAPEVMFWYNDYVLTGRKIFLDGRKHPAAGQASQTGASGPTYSGHSVGHWEGKTLVVDTVDMMVNVFDETGSLYSPKLHMVERLRLVDTNVLENQMTFTDPEAFTQPWMVTRYYRRGFNPMAPAQAKAGPEPIVHQYINLNDRPCVPNVGMDENGFQVVLLPQEVEAAKAKAEGRPAAGAKAKKGR